LLEATHRRGSPIRRANHARRSGRRREQPIILRTVRRHCGPEPIITRVGITKVIKPHPVGLGARVIKPKDGKLGSGRSAAEQIHIKPQRVIATESLPVGVEIQAGGVGVIVLVHVQPQPKGIAAGVRGGRHRVSTIIIGKGAGIILQGLLRAKLDRIVGRGVHVEVIGPENRLSRVFIVNNRRGGQIGCAQPRPAHVIHAPGQTHHHGARTIQKGVVQRSDKFDGLGALADLKNDREVKVVNNRVIRILHRGAGEGEDRGILEEGNLVRVATAPGNSDGAVVIRNPLVN